MNSLAAHCAAAAHSDAAANLINWHSYNNLQSSQCFTFWGASHPQKPSIKHPLCYVNITPWWRQTTVKFIAFHKTGEFGGIYLMQGGIKPGLLSVSCMKIAPLCRFELVHHLVRKMSTYQLRTQYLSIETGQMVNLHCVWKPIIKWTHSQANDYLICVEAGYMKQYNLKPLQLQKSENVLFFFIEYCTKSSPFNIECCSYLYLDAAYVCQTSSVSLSEE